MIVEQGMWAMRWTQMVRTLSVGLLAFAAAGSAQAAMLATPVTTAINQLKEWNLVAFNNYTANNEVEGRVFVGGNMTSNYQYNFKATTTSANGTGAVTVLGNTYGQKIDFRKGDLVVGGSNYATTLEANSSGTAYIGGTDSSQNHNNFTPQTGLAASNPNFTSTLLAQKNSLVSQMTNLSTNLKALANQGGTLSTANNALTYTASSANNGFNVLNLTVDQINQYAGNYIDIISPDGTTTVINVSGSGTISKNFNSTSSAKNIIWNFYDATNLTLGNWQGSVLAVNADFVKDTSGAINGSVVAKNVTNNAEVHSYSFQGDLSSVGGSVSAMPEPTTWAMLILGFGLVGGMMRRQRGLGLTLARA